MPPPPMGPSINDVRKRGEEREVASILYFIMKTWDGWWLKIWLLTSFMDGSVGCFGHESLVNGLRVWSDGSLVWPPPPLSLAARVLGME